MKHACIAVVLVLTGFGSVSSAWVQAPVESRKRPLSDFDIRDALPPAERMTADQRVAARTIEERKDKLESFLASPEEAQFATRIVPNSFGLPKLYLREGRSLTAPSSREPLEIAKNFLRSRSAVFSLAAGEVDGLRLVVEDVSARVSFLVFNQTLNGIDVFNGQMKVTLSGAREVIQVTTGDVVPGLSLSTIPGMPADQAVKAAFSAIGSDAPQALNAVSDAGGKFAFANPQGASYRPITSELVIFPMTASSARLAYRIFLEVDNDAWYEMLIDAETGALLFRHNLYVNAQANVWTQSPMVGTRTLVTFPESSAGSPEGWLPQGGTVTRGNNVDAYVDANGDGRADTTPNDPSMQDGRPFSTTQVFDFIYGDGLVPLNPRSHTPAAVTNLFYFVNTAHDYYHSLGFNEAAGSFQANNFGRGGVGGDAVLAEAQSARALNNAAFAPTPEGIAPRMRMGLFTRGTSSQTDDLDSDYDGEVVFHEYGHGVSTRLVGGGSSTSCLIDIQSGAMGEGWSDYFAMSFFNSPVHGAYLTQNSTRGIRRQSYEGYTFTYEDIGNSENGYEVHDDGEIWAATLWDLRKSLGQTITDRLVMDGLKATPCDPSMTNARDAILSADQATNQGANRQAIWRVFARHGMGFSAVGVDGSLMTGTRYDASYDLPPDMQTDRNPAITSDPLSIRPGSGDTYRYNIAASNPGGGTLSYELTRGANGMSIGSTTGAVNWIATFTSQRIKITVTDGRGGKVVHGYALPVLTILADDSPKIISADSDSTGYASFTVPPNTSLLQFTLRGGSGDSDLIVTGPDGRFFISPRDGNNETLSIVNPIAGPWDIEVFGFDAYAGVSLKAALVKPGPLAPNTTLSNLTGVISSETFYRVAVPSGATSFSVTTSGGTGDVDIYVRRNLPASCQSFLAFFGYAPCLRDSSSAKDGNEESISVTNPQAGDWYIDVSGFDDYAGVTLEIRITVPAMPLSNGGVLTTSTTGASTNIATGYATTSVASGTAPYGTAVFSLTQNGNVVSEAGIPASPPVQSARIFIDYRTGVAAGSGTLDVYTGFALANRGTSTADLTYTLRDRNGQTIATGVGTLAAGAHRAKFIHELRDIAPAFNLPANFATAILYGSLEISSSQPTSMLSLRLTTNQRGETLLTSTPVADLSRPPATSPVYFPQLVDGGGYATSVVLLNTSGSAQRGTISTFDDAGTGFTVKALDGTVASSFSYNIPANGTFVFQTDGSNTSTKVGSIKVTPDSGNTAPTGVGVLSYSPAGILITESGVPSASPTIRARLFIDRSAGHDTGLAVANPGTSGISVAVRAFEKDGTTPAGSGQGTINLAVNGHRARFVAEMIEGLPDGFTGVAEISSTSPFVALTLRGLTNRRGDFLLTTFPIADPNQPAPTPIVFPHIADGGGYSTQFIFISASGAASVNVDFFGSDGAPLSIPRN